MQLFQHQNIVCEVKEFTLIRPFGCGCNWYEKSVTGHSWVLAQDATGLGTTGPQPRRGN